MKRFIMGAVLALACSTAAYANTISVNPTPLITGAGPYTWSYGVTLEGLSQINNGDFFTIFDFAGFVPGSQNVIAGWAPASANTGVCPAQIPVVCAAFDDPGVPNLTWVRTGGVILGPGIGGSLFLGNFSAVSIYNQVRNDAWVSQDQDNQTRTPGEGAFGNTNVPQAAVPEPATLSLVGLGLVAAARRLRRR